MIDTKTCRTLCAVDEIFDAVNPVVSGQARRFLHNTHAKHGRRQPDADWLMLHSPRTFGEHTLHEVLSTLPLR